jgi:hypothetical protein
VNHAQLSPTIWKWFITMHGQEQEALAIEQLHADPGEGARPAFVRDSGVPGDHRHEDGDVPFSVRMDGQFPELAGREGSPATAGPSHA